MRIIFRTDASLQIGSGHVMRCLTLADELRQRGVDITFVCREHSGNLISMIEGKGYPVVRLAQSAGEFTAAADDVAHASLLGVSWTRDAAETVAALAGKQPHWLIVDHYALDRRWEEILRPHADQIMVIDDLADRPHTCDLLLDQNLYHDMETRYIDLLPAGCKKLLGPRYALLRPEFAAAAKKLRRRDGQVKRVLVFFGGVDPTNETEKVLHALASITDRQFDVDAVVGVRNPHQELIKKLCAAQAGFHYHCQISNMAELMATADLAIGAGGTATWERCYLALPSITLINADNQLETSKAVATAGASIYMGACNSVSSEDLATTTRSLLKNPVLVKAMGEKSLAIMGNRLSQEHHTLPDVIMGRQPC